MAVSMDERLENLYHEAGLPEELLLSVEDPNLADDIARGLARIDADQDTIVGMIEREREHSEEMCQEMTRWFCDYLNKSLR